MIANCAQRQGIRRARVPASRVRAPGASKAGRAPPARRHPPSACRATERPSLNP